MAATFRILSQRPSTELTGDGRFIDTMEITFETLPNRTPGNITIPRALYTPEYVREHVSALADTMIAVENL